MPATPTKVISFEVCCPFCGGDDATVKIDLNDLTTCCCSSCDVEFSPQEAAEKMTKQLEKWKAVAAWISAAPVE